MSKFQNDINDFMNGCMVKVERNNILNFIEEINILYNIKKYNLYYENDIYYISII